MKLVITVDRSELDGESAMHPVDYYLERSFQLSAERLWQCWTEAQHLRHFFIPKPHHMKSCELHLKVGGRFNTCFEVNGQEILHQGIILALVKGQKIVFSDSYREGWFPQEQATMTVVVSIEALSTQSSRCRLEIHAHALPELEQYQCLDLELGWQIVLQQLADYQQQLLKQRQRLRPNIPAYNLT